MKSYDDVYRTPGAFSWNELTTSDPEAAAAFYGALFGWTFESMDVGMPYRVIKAGGTAVGGLMGQPPGSDALPITWGSYVTVADADATARRCVELGGRVVHGPADIPNVGRFVVMVDPQGAVIHAIAYAGG
ncbi:MAG TPA: VOC family protein [Burkholderiaceae bacterium]|nr:VOC family protein [Burkholderiaceae bacterium]